MIGKKCTLLLTAMLCLMAGAASAQKTRNVVLIVSDGLRWQEVFTGADPLLLDAKNGGNWEHEDALRKKYWRDDVGERRSLLFPFLWGTVAAHGQMIGNQTKGSIAHVSNKFWFSYPGYNEMSVGIPSDAINSNEFGPNPNVSVFEWLNKKPDLKGRVAVFATWNMFEDIFNHPRSGLVFQTGWNAPRPSGDKSKDALLREMFQSSTRFDEEDPPNLLMHVALLDYVKQRRPRVLFVGYGETDNWAHQGRYDLVLDSAHRVDGFIKELWNTMQAMPQYRGTTTFIITADHGRGSGPVQWKEHGVEEEGSQNVWMAVIGPDTPALGERHDIQPVVQAQIAATVAALLGRDYRKDVPAAAPPLADVIAAGTAKALEKH